MRHHARQLLQASSGASVPLLPPEVDTAPAGALFLPPCVSQLPCAGLDALDGYVNTAVESVVMQKCVALPKVSTASEAAVTGLQNDTLYRVVMVHSDLHSNEVVLSALARTQDLTPPVLTVVSLPPPDFNKFSVVVRLNEPDQLYAGLLLSTDQGAVSVDASCPPVFKVSG